MSVNNSTNNYKVAFGANIVRNLNVAKDPHVKRIMEVADDFFAKTTKSADKELRMYKEPGDYFVTMSLFNKKDRYMHQAQGFFNVESLVEDNPSNSKLVSRLKKLIKYLEKEEKLIKLSGDEIAAGKDDKILKQLEKIAGKDQVLLDKLNSYCTII